MNKLFLFSFLIFFSAFLMAQESSKAKVQLKARYSSGIIKLRWGVDQPLEWNQSKLDGFYLSKTIYAKNGKSLTSPEVVFKDKIIKPEPLENWESLATQDKYAAILAQSLYGESFAVEMGSQGELADIVNLSTELEQRFSMGLLAAEFNFEAAKLAALAFVDTDVVKGYAYIYTIKSVWGNTEQKIQSGSVLVRTDSEEELPIPMDLSAIFLDKTAMLSWEEGLLSNVYSYYELEKSTDGKQFSSVSSEPLINLGNNNEQDSKEKRMFFVDSLAQNSQTYYYRLRGVTPFGEKSPYSDVVSGSGYKSLTYIPEIKTVSLNSDQTQVNLVWEYPKEGEEDLEKFQLLQAGKDEEISYKIVKDNIPKSLRKISQDSLGASNYFVIQAVAKEGREFKKSFPKFVQPLDTIPPAIPIGLKGEITKEGLAKISWQANTEADFFGYKVYRANLEGEEPIELTSDPFLETVFQDSVVLKSLNPKVFYAVLAVDKRFNASELTQMLVLEKPDVVPPTSPIFTDYKITDQGILLSWQPAKLEEGLIHKIIRQNTSTNSEWKVVSSTNKPLKDTQSFLDIDLQEDNIYRYAVMATDKNGLESEPSPVLSITYTNNKPKEAIKSFTVLANRSEGNISLNWKANNGFEVAEWVIYKSKDKEKPSIWKELPGKIYQILDKDLEIGSNYSYSIKPILKNGYGLVKTEKIFY